MKRTCKYLLIAYIGLFTLPLLAQSGNGFLSGGEISYECLGNDDYSITVNLYRDCAKRNFTFPNTVQLILFSKLSGQSGSTFSISPSGTDVDLKSCTAQPSQCAGGSNPSLVRRTYKGSIKLPSKRTDWTVSVSLGTRTDNVTTLASGSLNKFLYLDAVINNTAVACNTSPSFGSDPLNFVCANQPVDFSPSIINTDKDQLSYSIIKPRISDVGEVEYLSSAITSSTPITINPTTGNYSFTPTLVGEKTVLGLRVKEIRNGVEIGSISREMHVQVLACQNNLPVLSSILKPDNTSTGADSLSVCVGDTVLYRITGSVATAVPTLRLEARNVPPGMIVTTTQSTDRTNVVGFFRWIPRISDTGLKTIPVTVTDGLCPVEGRATKTYLIRVNPRPSVDLSTRSRDTLVACNFSVNLRATPANGTGPYTYRWNTEATTQNLQVTSVGTYRVRLLDAKGCSATDSVRFRSTLTPFFTAERFCIGQPTDFTDRSISKNGQVAITEWTWDFGDGSATSTQRNPKHTYNGIGPFVATLTVKDAEGCTGTFQRPIIMCRKPKAVFTYTDSCQTHIGLKNKGVTFFSNSAQLNAPDDCPILPSGYVWRENRLAFALGPNPGLLPLAPGNHIVTLIVTNTGSCSDSITKTVTVHPKPIFVSSPGTFAVACNTKSYPDSIFVTKARALAKAASIADTLRYEWLNMSTGNIVSRTGKASIRFINATMRYSVTVTDTLGCMRDTSFTIQDPIIPSASIQKYYCKPGDSIALKNTSQLRNTLGTTLWQLGDGTTQSSPFEIKHLYKSTKDSIYTVQLLITDATRCVDTARTKIVHSFPDTSRFGVVLDTVCFNQRDTILATTGKYINSWTWKNYNANANDSTIITNAFFGTAVPNNIDLTTLSPSGLYYPTLTIVYNRDPSDISLNGGCVLTQKDTFYVSKQLVYFIRDEINQCMDSSKLFRAVKVSGEGYAIKGWTWTVVPPPSSAEASISSTDTVWRISGSTLKTRASSVGPYNTSYPPYKIQLTINDAKQCNSVFTKDFGNEKPRVVLSRRDNIVCLNRAKRFVGEEGEMFDPDSTMWDFKDGVKGKFGLPTGHVFNSVGDFNVVVTVKNRFGCKGFDSVTVTTIDIPFASFSAPSTCYGAITTLDASASRSFDPGTPLKRYIWSYVSDTFKLDTVSTAINPHLYKSAGRFNTQLIVVDQNECTDTTTNSLDNGKVVINPVPKANFDVIGNDPVDPELYLANEPITFKDLSDTTTQKWAWHFGDGNKDTSTTANRPYNTTYVYPYDPVDKSKNIYTVSLVASTNAGCKDSVSREIDLNAYFTLPNAFSPNNDGLHDQLIAVGKGIKSIKEFKVYNRWGQLVYESSGKPERIQERKGYLLWTGDFNGQDQPVGSYVFYAVVTTGYGNDLVYKGNLTLVR